MSIDAIAPADLPVRKWFCGPVTAKRLLRLLLIYLALFSSGLLLASFSVAPAWQAFGLGLMLPGGGFLAHADISSGQGLAHIGIAVACMFGFILSLGLWLATGNVLAPPAAWLVFAIAAMSMKHGHIHSTAISIVVGVVIALFIFAGSAAVFLKLMGDRQRKQANLWLRGEGVAIAQAFSKQESGAREFSHDDVKRMRFLLDRALQPVNEFNGFDWLDQYQTAAVRYQLNFLGYALSMAQATHLPAFKGYLSEAQHRLILKQTDHRIWRYWTSENLWGNLRYNPDPIVRENIMFTGFCAAQIAMYHKAAGRDDFNKSGSFTLKHPSGKNYAYSLPDLNAALVRDSVRSQFHLIACEPNWIYPLCNAISFSAVQSELPQQWAGQKIIFQHMLETEFLDASGTIVPCRSNYTGIGFPTIGGAMPQALPSFFLNATLPSLALRQWLLVRRQLLSKGRLRKRKFWPIDIGNYRFTRAACYSSAALAAAEFGDDEVRDICFAALDKECPVKDSDGDFYRPKASVWAHAFEFLARSTVPHAFCNLMTQPAPQQGVYIDHVAYPDVLVASAHYANGELKAVLYPGNQPSLQPIRISGLIAQADYTCKGTEEQKVVADENGSATLHVKLQGRTKICLKQEV